MKKSYVMIHVIKHNMDPNSNINYRRKIGPAFDLKSSCTCIKPYYYATSFLSHTRIHFMRTPEPLVHTQAQLSKLFLRPNVCHHKLRPLPAR